MKCLYCDDIMEGEGSSVLLKHLQAKHPVIKKEFTADA